ncbi:unnamed protein product [Urochloa humidicola]
MPSTTSPPPYGSRAGLVPRQQEDFGGGGAFPEVHVPQYPLSMGLHDDPDTLPAAGSPPSNVLALTVDAHGRVAFDAVVLQGENADKIVNSTHPDHLPKIAAAPDQDPAAADAEDDDEKEEVEATTARTRAALQRIVDARLSSANPAASASSRIDDGPAFVKYKPAARQAAAAAFNSGAKERVVRLARAQEDPVLPPKHKHRRVPRPAGSPPVTVMHSPPRPVSREDAEGWKIPPSVTDWKNNQGYCVPLDKRVAWDGRRIMQDVHISDGFAGLSEALYVAEQKAREAIKTREKYHAEVMMRWKQMAEDRLRKTASEARAEAAAAAAASGGDAAPAAPPGEEEGRAQRDVVREERRRERESERRREAASGRVARDRDRDVGERIALGMASTGGAAGEVGYDERLFNQDAGMGSGFVADDMYNIYSERLFAALPALSTLYKPNNKHGDSGTYGEDADEEIERIARTDRFKPDRGLSGTAERPGGKRERPVEFGTPEESTEADDDPFELDRYMTRVKEGKKH